MHTIYNLMKDASSSADHGGYNMYQEGVRARILYMGSKNLVKAAQGTHPPKSGNFGGSSVIKYSFLL